MPPHPAIHTAAGLALAGVLVSAGSTAAQAIRGHVLEAEGGEPIRTAEVVALDSIGEARAVALTDSAGAFFLRLPDGGRYRVQASHLAFDTTVSDPVDVAFDELVEVEVNMGRRAIGLAPLVVVARRRPGTAYLDEYHRRAERNRELGRGVIITRAQLDSIPGGTVGHAINRHVTTRFRAGTGMRCSPAVYWNGMKIDDAWDPYRSNGAEIPVGSIEGIEVYFADRPGMPLEYIDESCGVILLWSRPVRPGEGDELGFWKAAAFVATALFIGLFVAR